MQSVLIYAALIWILELCDEKKASRYQAQVWGFKSWEWAFHVKRWSIGPHPSYPSQDPLKDNKFLVMPIFVVEKKNPSQKGGQSYTCVIVNLAGLGFL